MSLDFEEDSAALVHRAHEAVDAGASGLHIRGLSRIIDQRSFATLLDALRILRETLPSTWLELSIFELLALLQACSLEPAYLLSNLQDAGLSGLGVGSAFAGGHDRDGLQVHRTAHKVGLLSTATLTFGPDSSIENRIDQLSAIYSLQNETGGFTALAVVPLAPTTGRELDGITAVDRLKTLAIARMFLDNIPNVQAVSSAHGLKVLQTSLRFGSNDLGWIPPVAGRSDAPEDAPEEDMRRIIRDAGFSPAERDACCRILTLV
jgi:cyclic dehypoxanthinyl futalosine synthase